MDRGREHRHTFPVRRSPLHHKLSMLTKICQGTRPPSDQPLQAAGLASGRILAAPGPRATGRGGNDEASVPYQAPLVNYEPLLLVHVMHENG
jgi:hypothetical protein